MGKGSQTTKVASKCQGLEGVRRKKRRTVKCLTSEGNKNKKLGIPKKNEEPSFFERLILTLSNPRYLIVGHIEDNPSDNLNLFSGEQQVGTLEEICPQPCNVTMTNQETNHERNVSSLLE
jgi:hypothetical protein